MKRSPFASRIVKLSKAEIIGESRLEIIENSKLLDGQTGACVYELNVPIFK